MYTVTQTFTGPQVTAKRTGECPTCGKKASRSMTFERTVNPWNKREDGQVKTWDEVRADVKAEAESWQPEPSVFEHSKCYAERTAPPRAEPVPVPAERLGLASKVRAAMAALSAGSRYDHDTKCWVDDGVVPQRVGKGAAGRLLDGRTWDEYPAGGAE